MLLTYISRKEDTMGEEIKKEISQRQDSVNSEGNEVKEKREVEEKTEEKIEEKIEEKTEEITEEITEEKTEATEAKTPDQGKGSLKDLIATLKSEDISLLDKKKQLDGEYQKSYKKIEECFTRSNISTKERGECMDETLDMLINAKNNHVSVESIIGKSEKAFCTELINARGNKGTIMQICRELLKVPIFAFFALVCFYLLNSMDIEISEAIYTDVAMLDLFVPVIIAAVIANIVRFSMISKHGIYSDIVVNANKYIVGIQFIVSLLAYALIEETIAPNSYATTFGRCLFVATYAVVIAGIIMTFVSLGGFEIIYRNRKEFDIHSRNYELMLTGFARQFIKKNKKNERKNLPPVSIMDYANEILDDIELTHKFLPFVVVLLVAEIYFLGFLMLGIGARWYLIIAVLIIGIAIAICTSFIVTGNARSAMLGRIVEGDFDPKEFVEYEAQKSTNIKA